MVASEDHPDPSLRGRTVQLKVKLHKISREVLPELNDDFAKDCSEFDTLDELKEDLKKAASQDAEGRQATAARDAFIAKLEEGLEIPVPKGVKAEMVEQQLKGVTADPANATKEQKAEAEETVEKELRDQMVLGVLATEYLNYVGGKYTVTVDNITMTLFSNPTVDILTCVEALVVMITAGVVAGLIPARKAVKVKPIEALRAE